MRGKELLGHRLLVVREARHRQASYRAAVAAHRANDHRYQLRCQNIVTIVKDVL